MQFAYWLGRTIQLLESANMHNYALVGWLFGCVLRPIDSEVI